MAGVDVRDDKRNIGIAAVVLCVGEHNKFGSAEGSLYIARNIVIKAGKDDGAVLEVLCLALVDDDVADVGGDAVCLLPVDGGGVGLSGRPWGCTEGMDDEPGVVGEEADEALADGASCAEDTYFEILLHEVSRVFDSIPPLHVMEIYSS